AGRKVKDRYTSLVAEWLANGRHPLRDDAGSIVSELIATGRGDTRQRTGERNGSSASVPGVRNC
ncbi:MAG: hypothetical protein ACJ8F7_13560, partial [Gemmataceae bacterium]